MPAAETKLTIFRGEVKSFDIPVLDAAGAAVDVSSWTNRFVVAKSPTSATPHAIDKTGLTISGAGNNVVEVRLLNTDTDIAHGLYYWELRVQDTTTDEQVSSYGSFVVLASPTN